VVRSWFVDVIYPVSTDTLMLSKLVEG
jgi:hypothetical protein